MKRLVILVSALTMLNTVTPVNIGVGLMNLKIFLKTFSTIFSQEGIYVEE